MSGINPGDHVVAIRAGWGWRARSQGQHDYSKGDEFEVTSVRSGGRTVNVRPLAKHDTAVFKMDVADLRLVPRRVGQVPPGGIAPEDERIAWIFEDAARMADRLGLCSDFDRLCDALGLPGREREFTVQVARAEGITVTARVVARSRKLAEAAVRGLGGQGQVNSLRATWMEPAPERRQLTDQREERP